MAEESKAPSRRLWIAGGAVVLILAVVIVIVLRSGKESTDDAQIEGHITPVATRVGGTVVEVLVNENQYVQAGTVLAKIDPRDYLVAIDRAKAELADAQANAAAARVGVPITSVSTRSEITSATGGVEEATAGIALADKQVEAARAQVVAMEARLRERQATATKAARDVERFAPLVKKEEISQQQYDAAVATSDAARASVDVAVSDVTAANVGVAAAQQRAVQARASAAQAEGALQSSKTAPEQVEVKRAGAHAAEARVKQAEAALAQAELNFERATVKAPSAGVVGRKSVEVGQIVQPGQPLLALVSLSDVWVVANFKETQLAKMKTGQRASVKVDALGGREFHGKIESISGATGAKFSVLPPENATGNYVKVVQRVPVKIVFDQEQPVDGPLRPGMSVAPTVYLK
jgi:membrane fusion protein (multidrug efflux system)